MPRKIKDITGQRFSLLVAISFYDTKPTRWKFKCDCGNTKILGYRHVIAGSTKSCGCLKNQRENKIGEKHGRLLVISFQGKRRGKLLWKCLCACGNITFATTGELNANSRYSCGCQQKEKISNLNRKHGMYKTRIYSIWAGIKSRCLNENEPAYKYYGAKGITIPKKWISFLGFYDDVGEPLTKRHTIDRIDTTKSYSKQNCKWSTRKEQARNTISSKYWIIDGIKYDSLLAAGESLSIPPSKVMRMCNGYIANGVSYPKKPNCYSFLKYNQIVDS